MGKGREGVRSYVSFFPKISVTKMTMNMTLKCNELRQWNTLQLKGVGYVHILFLLLQIFVLIQGISLKWNAMTYGNKITFKKGVGYVKILFLMLSVSIVLYHKSFKKIQ